MRTATRTNVPAEPIFVVGGPSGRRRFAPPPGYISKADAARAYGLNPTMLNKLIEQYHLTIYAHPNDARQSLLRISQLENVLKAPPVPKTA